MTSSLALLYKTLGQIDAIGSRHIPRNTSYPRMVSSSLMTHRVDVDYILIAMKLKLNVS